MIKQILHIHIKPTIFPPYAKIVDKLGGYAEVVSDMEYQLAKRIGVEEKDLMVHTNVIGRLKGCF